MSELGQPHPGPQIVTDDGVAQHQPFPAVLPLRRVIAENGCSQVPSFAPKAVQTEFAMSGMRRPARLSTEGENSSLAATRAGVLAGVGHRLNGVLRALHCSIDHP
jgi:hypothetical protein